MSVFTPPTCSYTANIESLRTLRRTQWHRNLWHRNLWHRNLWHWRLAGDLTGETPVPQVLLPQMILGDSLDVGDRLEAAL